MDGFLKVLVGAACVAILCDSGWYAYIQLQAARERAASIAKVESVQQFQDAAKVENCRRIVDAWETGWKLPAAQEFGESASEAGVESCRTLIMFDEATRKPANP